MTYIEKIQAQAIKNTIKWGGQDISTIIHAMTEELGEISKAYLEAKYEGKPIGKVFTENIDLGALGVQLENLKGNINGKT